MRTYRVQDLASFGRQVTVDGQVVQFSGHYAIVPESIVYYFQRIDDYQVGEPTGESDPITPSIPDGVTPETKGEPTISPNIARVTEEEIKPEAKEEEIKPEAKKETLEEMQEAGTRDVAEQQPAGTSSKVEIKPRVQ